MTTLDPQPTSTPVTVLRLLREVVLITVGILLYSAARLLASDDVSSAFHSAADVLQIERWLHLPREQSLQALLLRNDLAVQGANLYYAAAHLPVTGLALLWLFLRRGEHYRWARRALLWSTSTALLVYLLLPVAPPRMLGSFGFTDTAAVFGLSVYGGEGAGSLTNQYAAMPSLHVGWAVLVATVCIAAGRTRWRWLWLLHPVLTLFVVIGTGNHYWLDAAAGVSVVVGALWLTRPQRPASVVVVLPAQARPRD